MLLVKENASSILDLPRRDQSSLTPYDSVAISSSEFNPANPDDRDGKKNLSKLTGMLMRHGFPHLKQADSHLPTTRPIISQSLRSTTLSVVLK